MKFALSSPPFSNSGEVYVSVCVGRSVYSHARTHSCTTKGKATPQASRWWLAIQIRAIVSQTAKKQPRYTENNTKNTRTKKLVSRERSEERIFPAPNWYTLSGLGVESKLSDVHLTLPLSINSAHDVRYLGWDEAYPSKHFNSL